MLKRLLATLAIVLLPNVLPMIQAEWHYRHPLPSASEAPR